MGALLAFGALALLGIASRRPADHLGLTPEARRLARIVAVALLAASGVVDGIGGEGGRRLVQWVLLLAPLVLPVGLASTILLSRRS